MKSSFSQNLLQALCPSRYDLAMQNRQNDPGYQSAREEYDALFERIRDQLGADRKLMLQLEALQSHLGSMDDEWVYLQGIRDGVDLLRLVGLL